MPKGFKYATPACGFIVPSSYNVVGRRMSAGCKRGPMDLLTVRGTRSARLRPETRPTFPRSWQFRRVETIHLDLCQRSS